MTDPQPPAPPRRARRTVIGLGAALVLLLLVWLLRVQILFGIARLVEVRQPPLRSDVIFLLSGDARTAGRADHAARLYARGFAPLILIARPESPPAAFRGHYPNDADVNIALLRDAGVPGAAIREVRVPGGVTSTLEEGRLLGWYLRRHPVARVTVVTSEYHTRRARWAIRREVGDTDAEIRMSGARDPRFHAGNWWRSEAGLLAYFEEYVKWAHNALSRL